MEWEYQGNLVFYEGMNPRDPDADCKRKDYI